MGFVRKNQGFDGCSLIPTDLRRRLCFVDAKLKIEMVWMSRPFHLAKKNNEEGPDFKEVKEYEWIIEDSYTNYDTLKKLIRRYNGDKKKEDKLDDNKIIQIRNIIAHGRILGHDLNEPY